MNATELQEGRDYDCVAGDIRCRADRPGATVHEITVGTRTIRVLAHDEARATIAAQNHVEEIEG